METRKFIATNIREYLNEQKTLNESWYHGTPDARDIEKEGGFTNRTNIVNYVSDIKAYNELQNKLKSARESNDMDLYHNLLNKVGSYKKEFTYNRPLFLTDKYSVAKTYADPKRSIDYQNTVEKVYEVEVKCNKVVKIVANGDRFRFISIDKVKQGFINSGVSKEKINELISMFNYYVSDNKGIKTDVIAAIGNWLNFDCIDVVGVLDSYHGGTVKSTIRMVLNPSIAKVNKS